MIVDGFASEGFSIASYNFVELGARLSPSPRFDAVGDFSIGAWGFVSKTMEFVVSQRVYVARWACIAKGYVTFFSEPGKGAIVFQSFNTCNNCKVVE